ncbi:hypothetical protein BURMUCGD1_4168 [Burkholderia multivorans CGD1]|nr:hypothetical protein BURMUCGD1_4168 [Burkholderia multivorans CGD1]
MRLLSAVRAPLSCTPKNLSIYIGWDTDADRPESSLPARARRMRADRAVPIPPVRRCNEGVQ